MSDLDPAVRRFLGSSMIGRIATVSAAGRPQIMPLWFFLSNGDILMNNAETSPTVRNLQAHPNVQVLFLADKSRDDRRCLRMRGTATYTKEPAVMRRIVRGSAAKYYRLGGLACALRHVRNLRSWFHYLGERGPAAGVIRVTPTSWEFLDVPY